MYAMRLAAAVVLSSAALAVVMAARSPEILFRKKMLDAGISETCAIGDFNGDGRPDIFSGDAWYENPTWKRHVVRHLKEYGTYLASLSDIALDVDGDGRLDIVSSGWHPKRLWWSRNPGKAGVPWEDKVAFEGSPIEFTFLVDLDNDGKAREILPQFGDGKQPLSWFEATGGTLVRHLVSSHSYGHGIGAGDINGDGRNDIVTPQGWLEAPRDPRQPDWTFHPEFRLGNTSFIHVIDINGDGLADLVTGNAHEYGIFWMEQRPGHAWVKHMIDESWSQPHAITLVDLNGDGKKDILTGKRYLAHDGHDPGGREPLGIYWYEYRKSEDGKVVEWSRHVIDYGSRAGGGMDIPVADLDADGDLDFAAGGKSGLFLFENRTRRAHPAGKRGARR
ncbi:MAG: VCBS repeat-containing protein [Bryobacterales bacterium]|nr:VCBS repeat-containing protein [Bryobacterales bacterium]